MERGARLKEGQVDAQPFEIVDPSAQRCPRPAIRAPPRRRIPSRFADEGAVYTVSSPYRIYPLVFDGLVGDDDVLVDIGLRQGARHQLVAVEI